MTQNEQILLSIAIFLLLFLVIPKIRKKKSQPNQSVSSSSEFGVQAASKKLPQQKKLSLDERIELSWKFLYDITEYIVNKFTKKDIELVTLLGRQLLRNAAKYEHVVDLGIRPSFRAAVSEQSVNIQDQQTISK